MACGERLIGIAAGGRPLGRNRPPPAEQLSALSCDPETRRFVTCRPKPADVTLVIYVEITKLDRVEGMTLSSMVVSRDWQEVSVLECILGGLHMDVAVESEPQRALARLNKTKIDALI